VVTPYVASTLSIFLRVEAGVVVQETPLRPRFQGANTLLHECLAQPGERYVEVDIAGLQSDPVQLRREMPDWIAYLGVLDQLRLTRRNRR